MAEKAPQRAASKKGLRAIAPGFAGDIGEDDFAGTARMEIAEGYYRLIQRGEDGNLLFPCREMIVQVRGDRVICLGTNRSMKLAEFRGQRYLCGPLKGPYDMTPTHRLPRVELAAAD